METDIQYAVELSNNNNNNVTSGSDESPVSSNQLHSMFAAFLATMQTENTKLAFELKLNELSENLDAKLASVSDSLDTKLNLVSDSLNAKLNSVLR
jgi:hypothetical protein